MSLGPAGAGKETRKSESPGRAGAIHYGLVVVVVVVIIERYRRGLFRLIERDLD
jgi:xanthine/uracil permease